jgi:hypothetical protein
MGFESGLGRQELFSKAEGQVPLVLSTLAADINELDAAPS